MRLFLLFSHSSPPPLSDILLSNQFVFFYHPASQPDSTPSPDLSVPTSSSSSSSSVLRFHIVLLPDFGQINVTTMERKRMERGLYLHKNSLPDCFSFLRHLHLFLCSLRQTSLRNIVWPPYSACPRWLLLHSDKQPSN